jgi:hypothetical protein
MAVLAIARLASVNHVKNMGKAALIAPNVQTSNIMHKPTLTNNAELTPMITTAIVP